MSETVSIRIMCQGGDYSKKVNFELFFPLVYSQRLENIQKRWFEYMRLLALGSFPKIIPVATLSTCLPPYLPNNSMFSVLGFQRRFVVTVILSGSPCGQDT